MGLEGSQIDRYRILHLLGSGAMGDVYLAEDPRIGQQVAIKVIRVEPDLYPDRLNAEQAAHLFQREIQAIVKLDSPHILPLFDYGEEPVGEMKIIYMVMPYRKEGSLAKWLSQRNTAELLSPQEVANLIGQVAEALQHAHNRQIIHRDVKPSNLLLRLHEETSARPDILLADFGVAQLMTTTSNMSQSVGGTPTYMAPEQWAGEAVPASDQYALAIMTYELLTGRPPFRGAALQIMYQHMHNQPPAPGTQNPRLSKEIDKVLLRALAKKADERFASVSAFARAFQEAVNALSGREQAIPTVLINPPAELLSDKHAPITSTVILQDQVPVTTSQRSIETSPDPDTDKRLIRSSATDPPKATVPTRPNNIVHQILPEAFPVTSGKDRSKTRFVTWPRRRVLFAIGLVTMTLLLIGGSIFILPGFHSSSAHDSSTGSSLIHSSTSMTAVTITSAKKELQHTYTILAVTSRPESAPNMKQQVTARQLTTVTAAQSQTAQATGTSTTLGTHASGTLTLYNYSTTSPLTLNAGMEIANMQSTSVDMILDAAVTAPPGPDTSNPGTANVPAHVVQTGTIGNLPPVNNGNAGFYYCTNCPNGKVQGYEIENDMAFSGGQNSQTVTTVQQSDIDNAANMLETANTPNPQQVLQAQIRTNEQLINSAQCKPNVSSNHAAGEQATSVTVTVTFTCTGEAYDQSGALTLAQKLLMNQAKGQFGPHYTLQGSIVATVTRAVLTNAGQGTITVTVDTSGTWIVQ